jgi:protein-disulfide isomerase
MKRVLLIIGLVVVLSAAAFIVYSRRADAPMHGDEIVTKQAGEPVQETNDSEPRLVIGNPEAPLTIIEYGDFGCPICKRFFEQTEPQLVRDYVDTGRVKIEFRVETHIGPDSVRAGEAAYCAAEQNAFKSYHDQLYFHQGRDRFSADNLKAFAGGGVIPDKPKFDACVDSGKYRATVEASHNEAQAKISGTPTFFVGGQKIVGAQPYSVFKAVIDAELAKL